MSTLGGQKYARSDAFSLKNSFDLMYLCGCVFAQSEKLLLFDTVQNELEEKIRRLEEDRHSIDITSGKERRHHNAFLRGVHYIIFTVTNAVVILTSLSSCLSFRVVE